MILNISILTFMVSFLTRLNLIWMSGDSQVPNCVNLVDLTSKSNDDDAVLQCEFRIGTSTDNKRVRSVGSKSFEFKNQKLFCRYSRGSRPLELDINSEVANNLAAWERKLMTKGLKHEWKNFNNLQYDDAIRYCIEEWEIQSQFIREVKEGDGTIPDCSAVFLPGPSKPRHNYHIHVGNFLYAEELKGKEFFPDLVRCYCAYLKQLKYRNEIKTAHKSKRFFYLLIQNDRIHIVFTPIGRISDRQVKILNVREIDLNVPYIM